MKSLPVLPFTVVITGGIASGKSLVSKHFENLGVSVIDTDIIAREVVQPGKPALDAISGAFGPEFFLEDGSLDRKKMRAAVFSDETARTKLEAILHPRIGDRVKDLLARLDDEYCILVIPLFAESSRYDWVDRVLVVDAPISIQIERVMERDGISRKQALAILNAQAGRQERLNLADDVILNTGTVGELEAEVEALHEKYLLLAAIRSNTS